MENKPYSLETDPRQCWGEIANGFLTGKNSFDNHVDDENWVGFDTPLAWYRQWQIDNHIQHHFPDKYDYACPHCANQGWLPGVRLSNV